MKILFRLLPVSAVAIALAGCASSVEDIQAANVDPGQYSYMTCAQLADYGGKLDATYKLAADQQSDARSEDVIGYALLQEPLGSQRHAQIPALIAEVKGRLTAIKQVETSKNCTSLTSVASN